MIDMLVNCRKIGIGVGLFAFTPVRGTEMVNSLSPDIGQYRRVQLAHFLLRSGYQESVFSYTQGRLTAVDIPMEILSKNFTVGDAFRASGCPDCNRPYYNERPGGIMYNYPRPLTPQETAKALAECALWEAEIDGLAPG
jgi:biotin synthase